MAMHGRPIDESARLLTVSAVAELLGISGRHIYRLSDSGRMPRPMKLGGAVRWDRDEIRRWIDAGCPAVVKRKGAER